MGNLLSDVRFCLRGFARRPMFAFVVVATLALGLSINAAIFSIYDQVLLRELRVAGAARARESSSRPGRKQGSTSCGNIGTCDEVFSYPMFRDLERLDGPFVGIAAHRDFEANLAIDGKTVAGTGLLVSGSYFPLLGLQGRRRPVARFERRSRGRRGERRRAELRLLAIGVRRQSRRRRPRARRQRQDADDRRRRAARLRGARRRLEAASVRADHVPLARQPERVPESHRSQELLGLLCSRV